MRYEELLREQLEHRTIREFKDEPVDPALLEVLKDIMNRTATATGMQAYSVIRITDEKTKEAIAEVGAQEYIARAPELWIFVVDVYRNSRIAREQGYELEAEADADRFFQGFTDAALAAQNVTNAVERAGLGAVFLGSILNDARKIIEILDLPRLTFPVVGLGFGVPNQEPQLKPRMPLEFKFFTDRYREYDNYMDVLADYDEEMKTYYDLRDANRRVDSFTDQVVTRLEKATRKRAELAVIAEEQGFHLVTGERDDAGSETGE
ncbi:nitroreductase [Peptoniphilus ivorii]|uniref:nitroreductase family protein n=1 Tax=Aedoeadaptatus ivorii TaxID=54006 RepID=UPI002789A0B0|nr:nitroreductase family protein [Peptoniphilus ivorii]MDQ0508462.1 nitroreductase [Peptoniphilus ivorii]